MRRHLFLAGTALAAAGCAVRPAAAREVDVQPLVARFPGVVGVYARTLAPDPPAVAVRDDQPFAAASVIKLPVMLTAFRAFDAGTASPDRRVVLRESDIIGGSPVLAGAVPGASFRLDTLIAAMIRHSDNTAANALITAFGFRAINDVIAEIGMSGTHLRRHFADVVPSWRHNLNVTTPRDVGSLLYEIERGAHEATDTVARAASCRAMVDVLLGQEYRDMIPAGIPRGVAVANKTGELDGERNDAAIVDPYGGSPYVLVVLARATGSDGAARAAIAGIAHRVDAALRG